MSVVIRLEDERLRELIGEHRKRAGALVRRAALRVEAEAKKLAPVDTGALMNSINTEVTGDVSAAVQDGVEYGLFQELGTSKIAAQPFLTPAVEIVRPEFVESMKEIFE